MSKGVTTLTSRYKSIFVTHPKASEFLKIITQYEDRLPMTKIYKKLLEIEPALPKLEAFRMFMNKLNKNKEEKANLLLVNLEKSILEKDDGGDKLLESLLNTMYHKLFSLGNMAIEQEIKEAMETMKDGGKLSATTRQRIIDWVFKASKSWSERRSVDLRTDMNERDETIMDNLIAAIQYRKVTKSDIIDGDFEEVKKQPHVQVA